MSAIDAAKAHFSSLQVRQIEVPEWKDETGKPLIVYAPPMTLQDKARLSALHDKVGRIEALAHVLILKAQDGHGAPLFTLADKHALMHQVEPEVLARVAMEIMASSGVEEMAKN